MRCGVMGWRARSEGIVGSPTSSGASTFFGRCVMRGGCLAMVLAASVVGAPSPPAAPQDKPPRPLPAKIVAAWERAGAETGWIGIDKSGGVGFLHHGREGNVREVSAFRFPT